MNSIIRGIRNYNTFVNSFKAITPSVSSLTFSREYHGSKRQTRLKANMKKRLLAEQLEEKYGISLKKEINHKEWLKENYITEFKAFQARLNIKFDNQHILISAFAHPSFTDELDMIQKDDVSSDDTDMQRRFELQELLSGHSFQNLSLLGYDTTLLTIKEEVYEKYPNTTSSICSDLSNFFTSRETISRIASNLAIKDLVLLSKELDNHIENLNEEYHIKFTKEDVLCDTFYSVVGAIVKDQGIGIARDFVKDFVVAIMNYEDLAQHVELNHADEELNKILLLNGVQGLVRARTISETGFCESIAHYPDLKPEEQLFHTGEDFPFFHVGIFCDGIKIADGSGYSALTGELDAFKMAVYNCLEGEVDFSILREAGKKS